MTGQVMDTQPSVPSEKKLNIKFSALPKRVVTGLILLAALCAVLLKGSVPLVAVLVGILSAVAYWEFSRLTLPAMSLWQRVVLSLLAAGPALLVPVAGQAGALGALTVVSVLALWLGFARRGDDLRQALLGSLIRAAGMVYTSGSLTCFVLLCDMPYGRRMLLFGLAVVIAADTAAYFVGNWLGRNKMSPRVSPNKSWEGFMGGLLASALLGLLLAHFVLVGYSWQIGLIMGIILALVSVGGDLFESALKRAAGVKDSGSLFPGHGGLLDRLDSILAALPFMLIFRLFDWLTW